MEGCRGQDGAEAWGSSQPSSIHPLRVPKGPGFLDPRPTVSREGVGSGTADKPPRKHLCLSPAQPHGPALSQCPPCPADARKICAQEGRAGT